MCTKEERDKRIREMMERKVRAKEEKMAGIVKKITSTENQDAKLISNTYEITDPNLCPQIVEGERYVSSLSANIQGVIKKYTGCDSGLINTTLRGKKTWDLADTIRYLDEAFSNVPPLTFPMTVYRGIRGIEKIRDDNGYSSCSLQKRISIGFGAGNVFEILLPIGTRVLFVKPISCFPGENEVLVDRSGEFRELLVPGKFVYISHL